MKIRTLLLAVAFALSTSHAAFAGQSNNLSGFDFNYSVDLNKTIGLTQVFDDGDRTYFQFTQAENLPTLYTVVNGKNQKLNYEVRPPYIIANGVANKYALSTNGGKTMISVSYNGERAEIKEVTKPLAIENTVKPSKSTAVIEEIKEPKIKIAAKNIATKTEVSTENRDTGKKAKELITASILNIPFFENSISLSKKAKEDLTKSANSISDADHVVVRGRPSVDGDDSIANTRALVIKNMLVDLGVDENEIEIRAETSPKLGKNQGFFLSEVILLPTSKTDLDSPSTNKAKKVSLKKLPTLDIKTGDLISAQIATWAKSYNYSLQWEAEEFRATAPLTLNLPFNETLDSVINAMKINGVFLDVSTFENNVVRIMESK